MTVDDPVNLPVSRGLKKARKLIRTMDDAAFRTQALRYISQYRTTCGRALSTGDAATLANDEAVVRFHDDDDAGCLQALLPSVAEDRVNHGHEAGQIEEQVTRPGE